jgi:hypothetical protein
VSSGDPSEGSTKTHISVNFTLIFLGFTSPPFSIMLTFSPISKPLRALLLRRTIPDKKAPTSTVAATKMVAAIAAMTAVVAAVVEDDDD